MHSLTLLTSFLGLLPFTPSTPTPTTLHPRIAHSKLNVTCCYETDLAWKEAEISTIRLLISQITAQNITTASVVAPHSCTWLACGGAYKFENEIILCNDNDYEISTDTKDMASYANAVVDKCKHDDPWPGSHVAW